jgi:hypothetical protein
MKTRGWEGWLVVSFIADTTATLFATLFATVAASASSLCHHQYACQAG